MAVGKLEQSYHNFWICTVKIVQMSFESMFRVKFVEID